MVRATADSGTPPMNFEHRGRPPIDMDAILARSTYAGSDAHEHYARDRPILYRLDVDLDDDSVYTEIEVVEA